MFGHLFTIHITHGLPPSTPPNHPSPIPPVRICHQTNTIRIRRDSAIESRSQVFFEALLKLIQRAADPAITLAKLVSELCHINATQPTLAQWLGLLLPTQPAPAHAIEHNPVHGCKLRNTNEYTVP